VRTSTMWRSTAVLLGLSIAASLAGLGRPALAVLADKAKSYTCSKSKACVSATNSDTNAGIGIQATSTELNGVQGNTSGVAAAVFGAAGDGFGVEGTALDGVSDQSAAVLADGGSRGTPLLLSSENTTGYANLLDVKNYTTSCTGCFTLYVNANGTAYIPGTLYTAGKCHVGCTSQHRRVASYGARDMRPVLEDVGEARLRDGVAVVRLDPNLAAAVPPGEGYSVYLTAEAETSGIYVAARERDAFTVRESGGGRSSLAFAYRIVAQSYAQRRARHFKQGE
jgi:hypothetical protein